MSDRIKDYYKDYGRKVYLYLMSMCCDENIAEDLTQETFYQAIRSLQSYKGNSSVFTWLCGIAKNLWLNEVRRQKYHPLTGEENTEADKSPGPEEEAEYRDSKARIMKKINQLPETEKQLIMLRASDELSFREIGELIGKNENWARVTYFRIKQKILKEEFM